MNRRLHDRALGLAAGAIDFPLGPAEAAELRAHLAACPACARSAAALRSDADAIRLPVTMRPSRRVDDAVYAAIAGREVRSGPRLLLLVAATALLLVALLGIAAAGAFLVQNLPLQVVVPSPSLPVVVVNPSPDGRPPSSEPGPTADPARAWTPVPASLPVASGGVQVAAGPDGGVYVIVAGAPASSSVLALLDADGTPRAGWPLGLDGWACAAPSGRPWMPAVAPDGSVRIVCTEPSSDTIPTTRAFAFDRSGRQLAGWPVDLPQTVSDQPRMVGDLLLVAAHEGSDQGPFPGSYRLVGVAPDGTVRSGARLELETDAAAWPVVLGPDGTAYRTAESDVTAFDMDGVRPGWPVQLAGAPSAIGFGPDGRLFVTVASAGTTRLVVLDSDGNEVARSDPLPIDGVSAWSGAGPDSRPMAPLVAVDGTAFVVGEADGHALVYRIDPSGRVMSGWPYEGATATEWQGSCAPDVTGCGTWRATPFVSADTVVYLPLAAPDAQIGGSLVAVGPDGQALPGWPMHLARRGSRWWTSAVASDGTAFALAVEPEAGGATSATIVAIARDGTVRARTTIVDASAQ